jgi:hypothetical protein
VSSIEEERQEKVIAIRIDWRSIMQIEISRDSASCQLSQSTLHMAIKVIVDYTHNISVVLMIC